MPHLRIRRRARRAVVVVALAVVGELICAGQESNDPFMRPAAPAPIAPAAPAPLDAFELTGMAAVGGMTRVCVADRAANTTHWLIVGQAGGDLAALEFDRQREAVRLQRGSESRWITMRKVVVATMAVPTRDYGAIDWAHLRMSDKEKAREAEAMVTDILEVAQAGRAGRLRPRR